MAETYTELAISFKNTKNEKVYNKLYKKMYPSLLNYVRGIIRDEDVAKDIVSSTMIKVYTKIDQYKPEYQITTWTYKIAYNEAIAHIIERSKKVSLSSGYEVGDNIDNSDMIDRKNTSQFYEYDEYDDITTDEERINEERILDEEHELVLERINNLEENVRDIMIYKFVNGMSYQEIEEKMNESVMEEFNRIQLLVDEAKENGDWEAFEKYRKMKNNYRRKNMIMCDTLKNRIHKGRNLLIEGLKGVDYKFINI